MTTERRLERDLPQILGDLAMGPYPDYIDDVLATTAQRRQRPAWTFPERWLPMVDVARQPVLAPRLPWRSISLALLLIGPAARRGAPSSSARQPRASGAVRGRAQRAGRLRGRWRHLHGRPRDRRRNGDRLRSRDGTRPSLLARRTQIVFERQVEATRPWSAVRRPRRRQRPHARDARAGRLHGQPARRTMGSNMNSRPMADPSCSPPPRTAARASRSRKATAGRRPPARCRHGRLRAVVPAAGRRGDPVRRARHRGARRPRRSSRSTSRRGIVRTVVQPLEPLVRSGRRRLVAGRVADRLLASGAAQVGASGITRTTHVVSADGSGDRGLPAPGDAVWNAEPAVVQRRQRACSSFAATASAFNDVRPVVIPADGEQRRRRDPVPGQRSTASAARTGSGRRTIPGSWSRRATEWASRSSR